MLNEVSLLRFKNIWHNMMDRCYNPKNGRYKHYGGRGIKVQESWHDFNNFKHDMFASYFAHAEKFGEADTWIERNDIDKDYCLDNCTWKDRISQERNKQRTVRLKTGESLRDYCAREGYNCDLIESRLRRGLTLDEAIKLGESKYSHNSIYTKYVGKLVKEFYVTKHIWSHKCECECSICGDKRIKDIHSLIRYDNSGCSCRKGRIKIKIGNNNYTFRELETLYHCTHKEMKSIIEDNDTKLFNDIINITSKEWVELLKKIHNDPNF